uniref:HDC11524 n=1 Tax=Drosophila melanogaster TaxID=7227 RepID=Q6IKS9_DROME|nr:TPA_inf: HDC11524 [Drosophila melanogaster]
MELKRQKKAAQPGGNGSAAGSDDVSGFANRALTQKNTRGPAHIHITKSGITLQDAAFLLLACLRFGTSLSLNPVHHPARNLAWIEASKLAFLTFPCSSLEIQFWKFADRRTHQRSWKANERRADLHFTTLNNMKRVANRGITERTVRKSKSRNGWKNTAQVLAILRRGPSNNEARRWSKANTTDCDNQRDNKIGAQEQSSDLDSN